MPNLRESILRNRKGGPIQTFKEYDENGNLKIWQEGGDDMDPDQEGIQDQPYQSGPPDESGKQIFMTNIPEGGMGPSFDNPQGIPGSAGDREDINAQAQAAGSKVIDLSTPKKPAQPAPWVGSGIDLNAPGERDRFRQEGVVNAAFNGFDLPRVNINEEMKRSGLDPILDKKAWSERFDRLTKEVEAAKQLESAMMAQFDKNAAIQLAMNERKSKEVGAQVKVQEESKKRRLELGEKHIELLKKKTELKEQFDKVKNESVDFNPLALRTIVEQTNVINTQVQEIEKQIRALDGNSGVAQAKGAGQPVQAQQVPIAGGAKAGVAPAKPLDKNAAAKRTEFVNFAKEAQSRGLTREQAIAEFQKLQAGQAGAGSKPNAKPAAAKVIAKPKTDTMPKPPDKNSKIDIGGPPVTIDTDSMKKLVKDVGLSPENWKAAAKLAADAGGFTIEELYLKPIATIKQLLIKAAESQKSTRKGLGL